jgi:predicted unusual protein kinase regulating ubiquinone biosynthesis (AarF/ABC1/UbiB family)
VVGGVEASLRVCGATGGGWSSRGWGFWMNFVLLSFLAELRCPALALHQPLRPCSRAASSPGNLARWAPVGRRCHACTPHIRRRGGAALHVLRATSDTSTESTLVSISPPEEDSSPQHHSHQSIGHVSVDVNSLQLSSHDSSLVNGGRGLSILQDAPEQQVMQRGGLRGGISLPRVRLPRLGVRKRRRKRKAKQVMGSVAPTGVWPKRLWAVRRTIRIWAFLLLVLVKLTRMRGIEARAKKEASAAGEVDATEMVEAEVSAARRRLAKYVCQACLRLGPTFIKVGQLLSTRIDILSREYIEELRMLQDEVPGFGRKAAVEIVERELGSSIDELYDSFDEQHIAAASLGQVHEAWLNGTRLAVKVQRPGLRDMFDVDLKSLKLLAALLDRFDPKTDGTQKDWSGIFSENSRVLYEEIDYEREGRNADRFAANFAGEPWVKTPAIIWSRTTPKVLSMEFVQGIKISEVDKLDDAKIDRKIIAKRISECYLAQLIRFGFFQADPHPGNLAVDGEGGGRVIFYDFGMMGEVPLDVKRGFVDLIFGIYENDVKVVCDSLEQMDVIRRGADRMTLERVARFYLSEFQDTLQGGGKWINQLDAEAERKLKRKERAKIGQELFSVRSDVPLSFPASFTFVFRAFTTLDGIGKTLDPGYDLTRIAQPFLRELVDLRDGNAYLSVWNSLAKRVGIRWEDLAGVGLTPRRVAHIDDVNTRLEQGDLMLRVRVLESERAFRRLQSQQTSTSSATLALLALHAGGLLGSKAAVAVGASRLLWTLASRSMFVSAALLCSRIPLWYIQCWQESRREKQRGFR